MADNLVTVINPDDKQPIQIKDTDLSAALSDGATYVPQISKIDLDGKGNAFVITPDDHTTIAVPLDKIHGALADGGRLASTYDPNKVQTYRDMIAKDSDQLKNYTSLDKIQDSEGKYLVKDPSSGQVFHLPQDQAMKLIHTNSMQFADSDFQAMVDAERQSGGGLRATGSGFKGVAARTPIIGSLVNKLQSFLTSDTPYIPGKAADIATKLNEDTSGTGEHAAHVAGEVVGTAGSIAGALTPQGLIGEGLAATKLLGAGTRLAEAAELSPLAVKAVGGAAQGLGFALPYIADNVINQDPGKAAESTLLAMGIGSFLHVAPGVFNGIIGNRVAKAAAELPNAAGEVLGEAGLSHAAQGVDQSGQVSLVRALGEHSPNQNIEQGLKNLVGGEHMASTLSKLGGKVEAAPLITKLEELGYATGASEGLNNKLTEIIHDVHSASQKGQIALTDLQKAGRNIVEGINYKAAGIDDVVAMKMQALDAIQSALIKGGDEAIVKAAEGGSSNVAKLTEEWENAKKVQEHAQNMISEFKGQAATAAPELTTAGKIAKNLFSQTGIGLQAKLENPGTAALNLVPGLKTLTGAKSVLSGAIRDVAEKRAASFDTWLASHPNSFLVKNMENPKIATFVALDSVAANNAKLAEIPGFLKELGSKVPQIFLAHEDPIKRMLGAEANGLSKEQQVQRLSDKVAMLAGNPQLAQQRINDLVQPFAHEHPEMAHQAQLLAASKIAYLHDVLHSANTNEPVAFQQQTQMKLNPMQLKELKDQLAAIDNPYMLLGALAGKRVTPAQVKAVQVTSPAIYEQIKQTINKEAYTGKTKLNYQQRISASLITGQPLDPTLKNVQQFQNTFGNGAQAPAGPPGPAQQGGSKPRTGHKLDSDKLPSHQTAAQRISNS